MMRARPTRANMAVHAKRVARKRTATVWETGQERYVKVCYQLNHKQCASSRGGEWSSEKWDSRQILSKSRNLAEPTNGSRSLRFCVCQSQICFSIKSLHFFVSGSDFKMPVSASRRVSDLAFATPSSLRVRLHGETQLGMSFNPIPPGGGGGAFDVRANFE